MPHHDLRTAQTEISELRARIAALLEEAATNERLFRKTHDRGIELLKCESLPQLFTEICVRHREAQALDAATLVLWDPEHEIRHLLIGDLVQLELFPSVILVDDMSGLAPQFIGFQKPWLGPYMGADHRALFPGAGDLQSIALIPLWRQKRLQGSLNFGSADPRRFTRHLGSDFLAHLGVTMAFALENTVNRARLTRSGLTDFLTGWHNRRYLHIRSREELARAQRQRHNVVCLIMDLDHFKEINDSHGHLAGDTALREAARRVETQIRGSDVAARFGGDEFVVLAPALHAAQAAALAERIRQAVCASAIEIAPGIRHTLTVSIGVASITPGREERDINALADGLLAAADAALYQAKQLGRNRVGMASRDY